MRKKVFGRKLNRNRRSRAALFRALSKSMIEYGSVKTTKAKALAVSSDLDKLISLVKKNDLTARRAALAKLGNDRNITDMLFSKYASMAKSKKSGFTKVALLPSRKGDSAEMMSLSWEVVEELAEKDEKKVKKVEKEK